MVDTLTLQGCRLLPEPGQQPGPPMDMEIHAGRIRALRPAGETEPAGSGLDARGLLAAPGLINGHHHSHEHFHKGRYDRLPLELWMNYVRPPEPLPLTPRQVYLRTLIGAMEALRSGTTTLVDDLNVSPLLDLDHVAAVYRAYEDSGIRALVGPSLFDRPFYRALPFVDEELPRELLAEWGRRPATPPAEVLALVEDLARERHPARSRVGVIAAPSAPQRCSREFLLQVRDLADRHGLPLITHVHETRLQAVTAQQFYGKTMIAYLDDLGFLKPATSLIHGVWLTPDDIERLARSGASVQHNPTSNLKLGSGLAPLQTLLDAGVNVSLGSDGCGSTETLNMHTVMGDCALVHKLRGDDFRQWPGAEEAHGAATLGGARALGREHDLGRLAVGYRADIALYRLDRPPFLPLNAPLRQRVYAETGASLDTLLVDGEVVMRDARLTRLDEAALAAEIHAEHARLVPHLERAEALVAQLAPAYERIYRRCLGEAVAPRTHPARL